MWSRMHEKKSARGLGSHFSKSFRCATDNKSFTPTPLPISSRSVINSSVFRVFPVYLITQTLNLFNLTF